MQAEQIKQSIERIESLSDQAKDAVRNANAPQELKQAVEQMHAQLSQGQRQQQQMGEGELRSLVQQLEQTSDRAMEACRNAGSGVDPQVQQAVQRTHDELSQLKKQIQMG